ncbi:hypothetical protein, partial [Halothiobacillus sp. 15-55-196]|uniref:hypothetical protein n=1 Tax=Halothiobacillus sp. 15-55-196 TaxID=1970382 RepID=UPI0025BB70B5
VGDEFSLRSLRIKFKSKICASVDQDQCAPVTSAQHGGAVLNFKSEISFGYKKRAVSIKLQAKR